MSKDSYAPGELIGLIRFVFDTTQSRTLNATQVYDSNPSQIVLASYPATSTIKTPAKSLGKVSRGLLFAGFAEVSGFVYPGINKMQGTGNKKQAMTGPMETVELGFTRLINDQKVQFGSKKANEITGANLQGSIVRFAGIELLADGDLVAGSSKRKSNANKDIFYGAITVGTLLYKEWQGKYAVLKVDLLTNNAILRVYNS